MRRLTILLCLCALCLCGCASRQLEEELLVIVLALDQEGEENIRLTVKVPSSSSANQKEDGYLLFSALGRGFSDALTLLRATTPRQLNFSQVREVVFGEAAARSPSFSVLLSQIDAIPRFRCSAAMIVCLGEARAFAAKQKPDLGVRLNRYAEAALSQSAGNGFTPDTDLCEALRDVGCGFSDPLLILGAADGESGGGSQNANQEVSGPTSEDILDSLPGALPRQGGSEIEIFGAAATDGVCVSGYLTGYEMALIHLAGGRAAALTMHQTPNIPLQITARAPAALTVDLDRSPALLSLSLTCEVRYPPGHPPDAERLSRQIERDLSAVIAHLQALRCDGMGFGDAAVRQFLTVRDWESLRWRET